MQTFPAAGTWLFWPDYSHDNPFQKMVYRAFPAGWQVRSAGIDAAVAALAEGKRPVVFHLHWEDVIYRDAPSAAAAESLVDGWLARLDAFIAAGGRLAWTVHNEAPHEPRFLEVDQRLRRALARRAHVVHMHSLVAAGMMAPPLGLAVEQVLVTPLGGFVGYYPDHVTKAQAREYFDLPAAAPVFVTVGALRSYKGVDLLLEAFAAVQRLCPAAHLIVAGRGGQQAPGRFVRVAPGVMLMPRYIDDATVQYAMRAADFGVFAFRRVMVSSSVLLAESFGLPVIVPDLPTLREMVDGGRNGFVYQNGDPTKLARTMLGAIGLTEADRAALSQGAMEDIRRRDWHDYTGRLVAAVMQGAAVAA